jgi:putative spermidine/putrescine transport system permease protein
MRLADDLGRFLTLFTIAIAVLFLTLPLVLAISMSFDSRAFLGPFPPPALSLRWYARLFSTDIYMRGLKTSLLLALAAAVVSTALGVCAAVALDRSQFSGKNALLTFVMSPLIVPSVVTGFALLVFFAKVGVLSGFPKLLAGHIVVTMPYAVRTTLASLVGIRRSLTEAAVSLGATGWHAFWDVTFPLAKTGIVAGGIFAFAFSLDEVGISMFLSDPYTFTLPVALLGMMRASFDLTIAAASVLLIAASFLIILLVDKVIGLDRVIGQGVYRN